MGGRAAEEIFLGDVSSGAQQDISQATNLARSMVCRWGMSDHLGNVAYEEQSGGDYGMPSPEKTYSEETARTIDGEVRQLMEEAYKRALAIVKENEEEVKLMSEMLIEFETLDSHDIKAILNHEWDAEHKRKKVTDTEALFKRQPETPPPPPTNPDQSEDLGLNPT